MEWRVLLPGFSAMAEPRAADARNEQRFSQYVLPELEPLMRLALSLTGQLADAEDLVQDTLLRAYRSIERFDGEHPRAWLFTIMRRVQANNYRRRRTVLLDDPETVSRMTGVSAADEGDPEQRAVGNTFDTVVQAAFSALPAKQQDVLRLVDIGGLSYAEAAQVLGVAPGTVMSRLHRARARIRQPLAAAGLTPQRRAR
jgi:RNA polymerase sigma-70 factor (ECF subfamily)